MTDELAEYELRVGAGTDALEQLLVEMEADLDVERGGIGWWHGYTDARRIALISEYLLASVDGVRSALLAASLELSTFKTTKHADDFAFRAKTKELSTRGPVSDEQMMKALFRRDARERERAFKIEVAQEHVFYHLAQALDRLAAVVIGVAAFKMRIVRADWETIRSALSREKKGWSKPLDEEGTDGRAAQDDLLDHMRTAIAAGPADWLPWMLGLRDANAHRAPQLGIALMVRGERGQSPTMTSPFHRQPKWPSVETMALRQSAKDELAGYLLLADPLGEMERFIEMVTNLAAETARRCSELWRRRRKHQTLLVQPGGQWREIAGDPEYEFDGFGSPLDLVPVREMRVHPRSGKRMQAAKLLNSGRDFWTDEGK